MCFPLKRNQSWLIQDCSREHRWTGSNLCFQEAKKCSTSRGGLLRATAGVGLGRHWDVPRSVSPLLPWALISCLFEAMQMSTSPSPPAFVAPCALACLLLAKACLIAACLDTGVMCWLSSVKLYSFTSFFIQHRAPSVHLPHFHLKSILLIMILRTTSLFFLFEQEKEPHPPSLFLCSLASPYLHGKGSSMMPKPTTKSWFSPVLQTHCLLSIYPISEHPSAQTESSVSS